MILFPFNEYWWFYLCFSGFILALLALDLGVFHKKTHEVSFKEASIWTTVWISLALIFNILFYFYALHQFSTNEIYTSIVGFDAKIQAKTTALEFLTGLIVEKSLAIDNIFVFAVVFSYFGIPKKYQHQILFWGVIGALVFRAIFIAMGSILMQYHWVVIFFGALLILTGIKMFFAGTQAQNLENNFIIKQLKKVFRVHPQIEGQKFFLRKNGQIYVTPLFLALIFLELSDIIFAVDSVPAIFAITKEPMIVFTSNIFAILGLRSMYFMLSGVMDRFSFIKYGLASVLIFVGLKMVWLNEAFGGKFPIVWSLLIIGVLIGSSILLSIVIDNRKKRRK
ncbi:TerC family protein [Fluviispira sanaruensis]|uniref:Membrane protein n=1 Tax=Fluviispira sanaruensis TaxID=2493639 RepID=A0A4V0P2R6_FLUSA|nr:TerC family protein [Fluviispira sanaruensis]BBH54157.1 membrane protein [Fluviispira sanaruensis]